MPLGVTRSPLPVVLVTFELRNSERLGRRTLVFRRDGATWRIVHLHASNIATPSPVNLAYVMPNVAPASS